MRSTPVVTALVVLLWGCVAFSQAPDRFEVVSIRPSAPGATGGGLGFVPGRFSATNYSILNLLRTAFGVLSPQIVDVPEWTRTTRYDIQATTPGGVTVTQDMIRNLLRDRFALRVRQERRDMPVYALVRVRADRLGPNLRPSSNCQERKPVPCSRSFNPDSIRVVGADWKELRMWTQLSGSVGRVIVDETGLSGWFDIEMKWNPSVAIDTVASTPSGSDVSLFTALQEQLGLRMESRRAQVDVTVIERIERPAAN